MMALLAAILATLGSAVVAAYAAMASGVARALGTFLAQNRDPIPPFITGAGVLAAIAIPAARAGWSKRAKAKLARKSIGLYLDVLREKMVDLLRLYADYDAKVGARMAIHTAKAVTAVRRGESTAPSPMAPQRPVEIGAFERDNKVNYDAIERLFLESGVSGCPSETPWRIS